MMPSRRIMPQNQVFASGPPTRMLLPVPGQRGSVTVNVPRSSDILYIQRLSRVSDEQRLFLDFKIKFQTVTERFTGATCSICYEDTKAEAIKCLHCKKYVACVECGVKWIRRQVTEAASPSCSCCRGDWKDLKKGVVKNVQKPFMSSDIVFNLVAWCAGATLGAFIDDLPLPKYTPSETFMDIPNYLAYIIETKQNVNDVEVDSLEQVEVKVGQVKNNFDVNVAKPPGQYERDEVANFNQVANVRSSSTQTDGLQKFEELTPAEYIEKLSVQTAVERVSYVNLETGEEKSDPCYSAKDSDSWEDVKTALLKADLVADSVDGKGANDGSSEALGTARNPSCSDVKTARSLGYSDVKTARSLGYSDVKTARSLEDLHGAPDGVRYEAIGLRNDGLTPAEYIETLNVFKAVDKNSLNTKVDSEGKNQNSKAEGQDSGAQIQDSRLQNQDSEQDLRTAVSVGTGTAQEYTISEDLQYGADGTNLDLKEKRNIGAQSHDSSLQNQDSEQDLRTAVSVGTETDHDYTSEENLQYGASGTNLSLKENQNAEQDLRTAVSVGTETAQDYTSGENLQYGDNGTNLNLKDSLQNQAYEHDLHTAVSLGTVTAQEFTSEEDLHTLVSRSLQTAAPQQNDSDLVTGISAPTHTAREPEGDEDLVKALLESGMVEEFQDHRATPEQLLKTHSKSAILKEMQLFNANSNPAPFVPLTFEETLAKYRKL
ncbi:unnamed protein product [Bursaphelenchus okinawaensis]|uniref:RING-type domain-containing protein n=1 Tax=Bursaphelenchus okinawaensis TaxID=465554 RepID=A0A811KU60_9BILA|nr:unnamed protein product [Bursaphelenchus okinawaensis]CAG9110947.1 unnamed protein product [Bursaphelenchus okinawaensis]